MAAPATSTTAEEQHALDRAGCAGRRDGADNPRSALLEISLHADDLLPTTIHCYSSTSLRPGDAAELSCSSTTLPIDHDTVKVADSF